MTIGEFQNCLDGYGDRLQEDIKRTDSLNHMLGRYIATGVNTPEKYPKTPYMTESDDETKKYNSDEEYERIARMKYGKK